MATARSEARLAGNVRCGGCSGGGGDAWDAWVERAPPVALELGEGGVGVEEVAGMPGAGVGVLSAFLKVV